MVDGQITDDRAPEKIAERAYSSPPDKPTVTSADRLAYLEWNNMPPRDRDAVMAGEWDSTTGMQVMARHREAAVAELRASLEGWAEWHRKACVYHDEDLTYLNGAGWDDADKLAEQTRAALSQKELNG